MKKLMLFVVCLLFAKNVFAADPVPADAGLVVDPDQAEQQAEQPLLVVVVPGLNENAEAEIVAELGQVVQDVEHVEYLRRPFACCPSRAEIKEKLANLLKWTREKGKRVVELSAEQFAGLRERLREPLEKLQVKAYELTQDRRAQLGATVIVTAAATYIINHAMPAGLVTNCTTTMTIVRVCTEQGA